MQSLPYSKMWPLVAIRRDRVADGEAGLTLVECIMAIVVLGIVGAAIAPMLMISVASRINSQKSEQALQLAQGEIDRVRVLMERGEGDSIEMPPATGDDTDVNDVPAPDTLETAFADVNAVTDARAVDIDGDGEDDFAIQSYTTKTFYVEGIPQVFDLGVRVYDVRAFTSGQNLGTDEASLALTNNAGERTQLPLSVLSTRVFFGENGQSFCNYIEFADSSADKPLGCD